MEKNKKYVLFITTSIIMVILICISSFFLIKKKNNPSNNTNNSNKPNSSNTAQSYNFGTWWWDNELDTDTYLSYAIKNNVTEIYFCDWNFDENTTKFLTKCNENNIKVYLLDGHYKWLTNDIKREKLFEKLNNFLNYQNNNSIKFAGVHLDIEPHQDPNFDINRYDLIYKLIELMHNLDEKYPDIEFHYDIPFWLNDEIAFNDENKPAYKHIIDIADKVTIMSYRDSAEKIYSVAKEEIEYAKSINKQLNLSVETSENEDNITFFEEGKTILNTELEKIRKQIPENFGISIHHIKSWYELV